MTGLYWLSEPTDFRDRLKAVASLSPQDGWVLAAELAASRLDFIQTNALDQTIRRIIPTHDAALFRTQEVRLAILGSCNMTHLHAAIRVAGVRRRIPIEIYECPYGQAWQEVINEESELHRFRPTHTLTSIDGHHLAARLHSAGGHDVDATVAAVEAEIVELWRAVRQKFGIAILHQTPLQIHPTLLGANEHRLRSSSAAFVARVNQDLRGLADGEGVDLISVDERSVGDGLNYWYNPTLWHRAKQEIALTAAPVYGDLVARLLGARLGTSRKCLVLDLDNTLWGGAVGDAGLEGIVLGQGSGLGEAFLAFQQYAKDLSRRGIVLAVSSKNDEATALRVFDEHPEMILRRQDIAFFAVNWHDKPTNLRAIAQGLNLGIDSLVFADDNPFERELVRRELPMVAVPELGDDPTYYAKILADTGYFEAGDVTAEDRSRSEQYQMQSQRGHLQRSAADLESYLADLQMVMSWRRFDKVGLSRIVQLINKTNQFNLTTRRYSEEDVGAFMADPHVLGLQIRLQDRFGDNGMIAVVIGRLRDADLILDTWLMSCRVLGRGVESATLDVVAAQAARMGARRLIGEYVPTGRNGLVEDHYSRLGFADAGAVDGASRAVLALSEHHACERNRITVREG